MLTWDAVSAADEYYIYRADTPDGALTRIAEDVTITEPTYTDLGLTNGTTYRYVVRADNSVGTSGDSSEVSDAPADAHGNTIDAATTLTSGTPVTGALACAARDVDYLAIPVTIGASSRPMEIVIAVDVETQGSNFLDLLDSNSMLLVSRPLVATTYSPQIVTTTGTYYIELSCSGQSSGIDFYTLTVTASEISDDHGDTSADATPVTSGTPVAGHVYRGDIDYFSIAVTTDTAASNTITISATTTGAVNTVGRIFDSSGMQLVENNDIGGNPYNINFLVTYNATADGTYYIEVTSRFTDDLDDHTGDYSLTVTALEAPLPDAPTGLTATPGNAQVSLSWTAVTDATEYLVYRAATPNGDLMRIASGTTITETTYTDTGLTNGTAYRYAVRAVDSIGESADSDEVSTTPLGPLATPTGLTASSGDSHVSLSWTAVAGAAEYRVYRAATSTGALARIAADTTITEIAYTDTGLTNGTVYRYVVRAVNGIGGESGNSNEVNATPADSHGNTRAAATALTAGTAATGALACPGDLDYFSIPVTIGASSPPQEIVITTNASTEGTNFIELQDSTGARIYSSFLSPQTYPAQGASATATYYIELSCSSTLTTSLDVYSFTVVTREVSDAHSNTRTGATAVTSGTAVAGNLYAGDIDYFSIVVTGATMTSPVTITATTTGDRDTVGKIYDSSGTKLAENQDIGPIPGTLFYDDNFRVTYDATTDGTYYVEVTGRVTPGSPENHVGDYSLTVTTSQ